MVELVIKIDSCGFDKMVIDHLHLVIVHMLLTIACVVNAYYSQQRALTFCSSWLCTVGWSQARISVCVAVWRNALCAIVSLSRCRSHGGTVCLRTPIRTSQGVRQQSHRKSRRQPRDPEHVTLNGSLAAALFRYRRLTISATTF